MWKEKQGQPLTRHTKNNVTNSYTEEYVGPLPIGSILSTNTAGNPKLYSSDWHHPCFRQCLSNTLCPRKKAIVSMSLMLLKRQIALCLCHRCYWRDKLLWSGDRIWTAEGLREEKKKVCQVTKILPLRYYKYNSFSHSKMLFLFRVQRTFCLRKKSSYFPF